MTPPTRSLWEPRSEPNVVPMLDVLLALVLALLVAQFFARQSEPLAPAGSDPDASDLRTAATQLVLELTGDGHFRLNGQPVPRAYLGQMLAASLSSRAARVLFLKIAPTRSYQEAIDAADLARGAGAEIVAVVPTDSPRALRACPDSLPVLRGACAS